MTRNWWLLTMAIGTTLALMPGTAAAATAGLTVDGTATYTGRTHTVTIRGTFLCAGAIETTARNLNLIQHNGQPNITFGAASTRPLPCDDEWHHWALEVSAEDGKFTGGTACLSEKPCGGLRRSCRQMRCWSGRCGLGVVANGGNAGACWAAISPSGGSPTLRIRLC